jgi:hypothetical protein
VTVVVVAAVVVVEDCAAVVTSALQHAVDTDALVSTARARGIAWEELSAERQYTS